MEGTSAPPAPAELDEEPELLEDESAPLDEELDTPELPASVSPPALLPDEDEDELAPFAGPGVAEGSPGYGKRLPAGWFVSPAAVLLAGEAAALPAGVAGASPGYGKRVPAGASGEVEPAGAEAAEELAGAEGALSAVGTGSPG